MVHLLLVAPVVADRYNFRSNGHCLFENTFVVVITATCNNSVSRKSYVMNQLFHAVLSTLDMISERLTTSVCKNWSSAVDLQAILWVESSLAECTAEAGKLQPSDSWEHVYSTFRSSSRKTGSVTIASKKGNRQPSYQRHGQFLATWENININFLVDINCQFRWRNLLAS